ncbi:hypothetical protein ABH944_005439 [Caballeronia udeis]|uniref:Uncharacterized protein n=1 Tax=Caballeronia udeis TaxID=1232866 RepID=A0ABW8MNH8_9BURK
MTPLPPPLIELIADPQGKRAEDAILSLVVDLEREGVSPMAIAKAMGRVLFSFCVRQGSIRGNFDWAWDCINGLGHALERQAEQSKRLWVRRFLRKTGRMYRDVHIDIDVTPPSPDKIARDRLRSINPQGSA